MYSRVLRRPLLTLLTAVLLASAAACGGGSGSADAPAKADLSKGLDPANPITVTVGVPRNFGYLSTLWARDTQVPGVRIEYKYFPVFSDMLAALNAGQIDLTEVGDVGAISSYANGGQVVAVATTEPNPRNTGLLVPKDSPAQSFADLKGKKIIFLKTTNTYTQFLKQVAEAGLKESDFTIVQIAGPDANKAFETGQVDAYYTIDPNLADVQNRSGARLLLDGEGYQNNYYVYTATKQAVAEKAPAIGAVISEVAKTIPWIHDNPDEQARLLSPKLGFSEAAIKTGYARGSTKLIPQDAEFLKREQSQVPTFVKAGLLPREVDLTPLFIPDFNAFINPT